jgi:hypothetical protein
MGTLLEWLFKQSRGCGEQQCHHGESVAKINPVKNLAMNQSVFYLTR